MNTKQEMWGYNLDRGGQGWRDESYRHRMAGMGISTSPQKFRSNGHRKFKGKEKYFIKEYETYGRFQGAVQRAVNSTFGDKYFWQEGNFHLKNKRTLEEKAISFKEAFESDDIWINKSHGYDIEVGQWSATMNVSHGSGMVQGFDIRWEWNKRALKDMETKGFTNQDEGEGHIYVFEGEYEAL